MPCPLLGVTEDPQSVLNILILVYGFLVCLKSELAFCSVPESVRASLPSPKDRWKHSSRGKGRKSEESRRDKLPMSSPGQRGTLVVKSLISFIPE